ncbi:hypothetical protein BS47DRAFT_1371943 [Hydnum rufescens UP504]|uniref:Iron permease FTR1 n=1 Tax=Hydnum rufescens UP504 TaxID=1448309 RepID=A0A9P6B1A9_9AGAM|nr:hypothetical protein BS47DRAFT_1371943 [Hydnum rufescens UP504]
MAKSGFYIPIFFIVLRETIEAVNVKSNLSPALILTCSLGPSTYPRSSGGLAESNPINSLTNAQLLRKLQIQVWIGAISGFIISWPLGGPSSRWCFYSNKVHDLWSKSENLWEGAFSLLASFIILIMGLTFLRLEQSKAKWRVKLAHAFAQKGSDVGVEGRGGKWALFLLPFITVLREGLEAVIFAGGVSLTASAASIPPAVVAGITCGIAICKYPFLIYGSTSRLTLHVFLVLSTAVLLLIGAGLFSSACGYFQLYVYNHGVGSDISETGDGPGSFDVRGNVWHLTYGNPDGGNNRGGGWGIFHAILGWTNNATLGTILCYVFYWIFVLGILIHMKWTEGRTTLFGLKSKAWHERQAARQGRITEKQENLNKGESPEQTAIQVV